MEDVEKKGYMDYDVVWRQTPKFSLLLNKLTPWWNWTVFIVITDAIMSTTLDMVPIFVYLGGTPWLIPKCSTEEVRLLLDCPRHYYD